MATDLDAELADLAERFRRGDNHAVDEVLRILGPALWAWLRKNFGGLLKPDELDVVVLDAWTDAWLGRANCGRENFVGWLFTIAYHAAVRFLRSVSIDGQRPVNFADADRLRQIVDHRGGDHGELPTGSERDEVVAEALAALPPPQREVMLSDYWLGGEATDREVASQLAVAESTVRSYRMRAKLKLREVLTDLGVEKFLRVQRGALYIGRGTDSTPPEPPESSDFRNGERGTGQLIVASANSVPQWRNAFRDAIPSILIRER